MFWAWRLWPVLCRRRGRQRRTLDFRGRRQNLGFLGAARLFLGFQPRCFLRPEAQSLACCRLLGLQPRLPFGFRLSAASSAFALASASACSRASSCWRSSLRRARAPPAAPRSSAPRAAAAAFPAAPPASPRRAAARSPARAGSGTAPAARCRNARLVAPSGPSTTETERRLRTDQRLVARLHR